MRRDGAPPAPTSSRRARLLTLALLVAALALATLIAEAAVRASIRRDAEGQEWIREVRLRPHRLPLARIGATLAEMQQSASFLAYDPDLGWSPRPGARSRDGARRVDAGGIRTDRETTRERTDGVLRVALFGDSFTFGDEVGQDETWGAALEHALAARGVAADVLNFGVNAYGLDQAYLRWQRHGRAYRPDVVLLGFLAEDALRNGNVFRPLYFSGSEVPLSKPRFVLRGDALTLVNVPTIAPDRLLATLADLEHEPLLAYERYWAPGFVSHWWLHLRTLALLAAVVDRTDLFTVDDETRVVALRIVDEFSRGVAADGARFLVVDLPRREDVARVRAGGALWYADLLRAIAARHPTVHPFADPAIDDTAFAPGGHYAPALNRQVGETLADPVLQAWRTPPLTRPGASPSPAPSRP